MLVIPTAQLQVHLSVAHRGPEYLKDHLRWASLGELVYTRASIDNLGLVRVNTNILYCRYLSLQNL